MSVFILSSEFTNLFCNPKSINPDPFQFQASAKRIAYNLAPRYDTLTASQKQKNDIFYILMTILTLAQLLIISRRRTKI